MPVLCSSCVDKRAVLKRPKTGHSLCKECFFWAFEEEVHQTIVAAELFKRWEKVGIAASGGKDSTVLAHVMKLLNQRYDYGLELMLLSVDEGITGYRDDSLETVKRNQQQYELPLKIVSYEELYGWTMDAIVSQVGLKNNCTFCGVFRRQALDRGAIMLKVDKICTGNTDRLYPKSRAPFSSLPLHQTVLVWSGLNALTMCLRSIHSDGILRRLGHMWQHSGRFSFIGFWTTCFEAARLASWGWQPVTIQ